MAAAIVRRLGFTGQSPWCLINMATADLIARLPSTADLNDRRPDRAPQRSSSANWLITTAPPCHSGYRMIRASCSAIMSFSWSSNEADNTFVELECAGQSCYRKLIPPSTGNIAPVTCVDIIRPNAAWATSSAVALRCSGE